MLSSVMATRRYTRTRSSAKSVDSVLDAAERLSQEGEFHSATVEALAEEAGISRATVFNRFGSKLGVLEGRSSNAASPARRCGRSGRRLSWRTRSRPSRR